MWHCSLGGGGTWRKGDDRRRHEGYKKARPRCGTGWIADGLDRQIKQTRLSCSEKLSIPCCIFCTVAADGRLWPVT